MKVSKALNRRLEELGYTTNEINELIKKYEIQAQQYINLMLKDINIKLEEGVTEILYENYIQFQLFSMVEMDDLVKDKKDFIDNTLKSIIDNYWNNKTKSLEISNKTRGIMVF